MPFASVEPARAAAPTVGLVASAVRPSDGSDRWTQGMSWRPEVCIEPAGFSSCAPHTKPVPASPDIVHYVPPGFSVTERCATLSDRAWQEAEARVLRQVQAVTSFMAAQELWSGQITRTDPGTLPDGSTVINPYLADGNATAVGTGATAKAALALLEAEALQASNGQRVFLHVSPEWVAHLDDSVRRQGDLLLTENDSVVVSDGGYPGTGTVTSGTAEVQHIAITGGTLEGTSEVQTLSISGGATGGTFTITVQTETTDPIAFDATAATVQAALEALTIIDPGDVVCTGGPLPGTAVTLTWDASLGNVAQPTADSAGLTGGTTPTASFTTNTEGEAPLGGSYTLTYDGQTTEPIAPGASADQIQAALEALPNLDFGDVVVTGSFPDWDVTFSVALGNVPPMTADDAGLTGGSTPAVTVTTTTEGVAESADAALTAYATGPVSFRQTDVEILGDLSSGVDRESNRRLVVGERLFAATFDPCIQLSVQATALS